jgi:hypothetical protein
MHKTFINVNMLRAVDDVMRAVFSFLNDGKKFISVEPYETWDLTIKV